MGTVVSFAVIPGSVPGADVAAAIARACALLHDADRVFSTWQPASPMSRVRRGEIDVAAAPPGVAAVLERCAALRDATGGWFDPWAMPGGVDPTGMVKGWAAGEALDVLVATGVAGAMVNAGGDIAVAGEPAPGEAWRLGIRHPWRPDHLAGVVSPPGAVATSAHYERGLHLVDPFSGDRPNRVASASITGPDLGTADALATAAAVAGPRFVDVVTGIAGYDAHIIGWDGREWSTASFPWAATEGHPPGGAGGPPAPPAPSPTLGS